MPKFEVHKADDQPTEDGAASADKGTWAAMYFQVAFREMISAII